MHPKQGSGSAKPAATLVRQRPRRWCVRGARTLPSTMLIYGPRGWHRSAADVVIVIRSLAQEASSVQARKTFHWKRRHWWACLPSRASVSFTISEEHTNTLQETSESPAATLASLRLGHPLPDESTRIVHGRGRLKLHGLHHVAVADTDL